MAKNWREIKDDGEEIVARVVEPSDLKGIMSEDIVIGPNEAGVIIKDGRIIDTITQTSQKNFGEGLMTRFKNKIFGSEDNRILFVDTGTIDIESRIRNTATKDKVKQEGRCILRFQININQATKLLNLMKGNDKLTKRDLIKKIGDEITANVFSPYISQYEAEEFRNNRDEIRQDIEEAVLTDMRKTFDTWGLNLTNITTNWSISDHEKVEREIKDAELKEKRKDIDSLKKKKEIEREYDVKSTKEQKQFEQRDQHLEHVQELDWKETKYDWHKEKTGVEHEEELKNIRTEEAMNRRLDQLEAMKEEDKWDIEMAKESLELKNELNRQKMKRQKHETDQEIRKYQGTDLEGKKVDADVEKTKAEMEAEKAKYNMDTYQQAQDKEREHQKDMTKNMAEMMSAAKQDVPDTLVQGADKTSANIHTSAPDQRGDNCPNCDTSVKPGWGHCPECGSELN